MKFESPPLIYKLGWESTGFSNLEFLRQLYPNRHVETCQRETLKWTLASWKRLPRRDTVHENNFMTFRGQVCFSCSCGWKVLARQAVWPSFRASGVWQDLVFIWRSLGAHEEATVNLVVLLQEAFRCHLTYRAFCGKALDHRVNYQSSEAICILVLRSLFFFLFGNG